MTENTPQTKETARPLSVARIRLLVVGAVFLIACGVITGRLVSLSVDSLFNRTAQNQKSPSQNQAHTLRAEIHDRNGKLLATSLAVASVFADPKHISNPAEAAAQLATILTDIPVAELTEKLSSPKRFVYLKRSITPSQEYAINKLGIPGIDFQREQRRIYPAGNLVSHAIGFTDRDNNGIAGIEKFFNDRLINNPDPLVLSIDQRVQHILRREALAAKESFTAIGAAGMVMDITNGEILGMVSLPDFDPNDPGDKTYTDLDFDPRFNRNTLGVYEMGSTFKLLTSAMALDSGLVKMTDRFDATRPISIGRFQIDDYHPQRRVLSLPEVIQYSSNIGTVHMAQKVGVAAQKEFMKKIGITGRAELEIPELGRALIPNPWNEVNAMTVSFGHGISITPLQMVSAVSAASNGGMLYKPTLVKRPDDETLAGERIIQNATSDELHKLMRLVVTKGTGRKANVTGYVVGGKTGTSEKIKNGAYVKDARISSFVGVFPMHAPRYLVMIMVDEPKPNKDSYGYATGGWVAAPAAGRVIAEIGPLLGVAPVDESDPAIVKMVDIDEQLLTPPAPKTKTNKTESPPNASE